MRRVTSVLSVAAIVLTMAGLAAQAKPSFAGKWTMDPASAPPAGGGRGGRGGGLGMELTITQDASTMTINYMGGGQNPAPVTLTYKLDGTESKNMMAGRGGGAPTEQVSKATWTGNTLTVVTTTGFGEQKRVFAIEGGNLTVETTAPGRDGGPGTPTKVTYKKAM
jgi:hypothetical protein